MYHFYILHLTFTSTGVSGRFSGQGAVVLPGNCRTHACWTTDTQQWQLPT